MLALIADGALLDEFASSAMPGLTTAPLGCAAGRPAPPHASGKVKRGSMETTAARFSRRIIDMCSSRIDRTTRAEPPAYTTRIGSRLNLQAETLDVPRAAQARTATLTAPGSRAKATPGPLGARGLRPRPSSRA